MTLSRPAPSLEGVFALDVSFARNIFSPLSHASNLSSDATSSELFSVCLGDGFVSVSHSTLHARASEAMSARSSWFPQLPAQGLGVVGMWEIFDKGKTEAI